jgi:folate/biopterin transporter
MKNVPLLSFYLLLGFCFQFPTVAMRYWMMEEVRVSPAQMSAIFGVVAIPWCMKPIYGFISDSYPLFGLRRRPYMVIMSYVSCLMWIILPFVPHDEFLITLVMTVSSAGLCFTDVMADSLLVEAAREESEDEKGIIQSWAWIMRFIGGLLASGAGALCYDWFGSNQTFLLNSMVPVAIAVLSMFIPDKRTTEITDWRDTSGKLWSAIRQPMIYRPALFIFLICVTPGYGGVMTFFYERELGFTANEFGMLDIMGYIVSIAGTFIYKRFLRNVSFPKIFFWALFLSFVLENTLLLLVLHTNREMGIPDFVFALIERIVITLVGQFISMPMVVLGARVCPVGVEGTLYALLMSITNMGDVVSSEWGSLLTSMFGVTSTNFKNLWKLMLLCNLFDLIPLFSIKLVKGVSPTASKTRETSI